MTLTGLQLSKKILLETKVPMNPDEMWAYALEKGYDRETSVRGKTPARTLGAQIYTNIQNHEDSDFVKVSVHPQKFGLRSIDYGSAPLPTKEQKADPKASDKLLERELHPFLVAFINSDSHFHSHTRTIYHENSSKSTKNAEKWMHPDLVSVRFPFDDLSDQSITLAKNAGIDTIVIFSFEMKREINGGNVRECYFQAVSNSSWANEGYLVAPKITTEALEQLGRLNSSFGIGVIRLDVEDVHQSEILLPSRDNDLDIGMINDLSSINPDFADFITTINDSMQVGHFVKGKYDPVLGDDQLKKRCRGV